MATSRYIVRRVGDEYTTQPAENMDDIRFACSIGGAALLVAGIGRGGVLGGLAALTGGGLLYKAFTGKNPLGGICAGGSCFGRAVDHGPSYANDHNGRSEQTPEDEVDEAAMESFPASDPPARSASHA